MYEHPHNLYGCDYCPAGQKRLEGLTRHTLPGRNVDSKDNLRLLCGVNFEAGCRIRAVWDVTRAARLYIVNWVGS